MKKEDQRKQRSSTSSNQGHLEMCQNLGSRLRARRPHRQHSPHRNIHARGPTMRGSRDRNRAGEEPEPRDCSNKHGEVISSEEIVLNLSPLLCLYSLS